MKEENRYFFVPAILFFVLILLVAYNFFIYKPLVEKKYLSLDSDKVFCIETDQKACIVNSCKGISVCRSSSWSECIINRTCENGSKIPCYSENSCSTGYRVCNECGNYGSCIYGISNR